MNIKQAKEKIASISKGTAIKHPKILIAELCSVINFLIDELQKNGDQKIVVSLKKSMEKMAGNNDDLPDINFIKPPSYPDPMGPKYGQRKLNKRMGNAGDAE